MGVSLKIKYNDIVDNLKSILKIPKLKRSQNKMLKVLLLLKEMNDGSKKSDREKQESDEQLDTTNMSESESEESAEQNKKQRGVGLKILAPDQILSRLPITLAQLKAGNNSEKLKNKIRQLLYSLYRSKKLTKTICNLSINAI